MPGHTHENTFDLGRLEVGQEVRHSLHYEQYGKRDGKPGKAISHRLQRFPHWHGRLSVSFKKGMQTKSIDKSGHSPCSICPAYTYPL
jgi:hypothetical protein